MINFANVLNNYFKHYETNLIVRIFHLLENAKNVKLKYETGVPWVLKEKTVINKLYASEWSISVGEYIIIVIKVLRFNEVTVKIDDQQWVPVKVFSRIYRTDIWLGIINTGGFKVS